MALARLSLYFSVVDPGGGAGGPISGGGGIVDTGGSGGTTTPPPSGLTIITASPLPFATNGVAYSATIQVINNTGAVTFSVSSGSLPTGLNLNTSTGVIAGTPTATATFPFTIAAVDSTLIPTSKDFTLEVRVALADPVPQFNQISLQEASDQLAIVLRDPSHAFWCEVELQNAIIESLRIFQAMTGYYRERAAFTTTAGQPFYDLRTVIPNQYAFTVTDDDLLAEIEAHLLEPTTNPWTGTDQFSISAIQSALANVRDQYLFDTGVYITRRLQPGPTPPAGRVTLNPGIIHIRRVGWAT